MKPRTTPNHPGNTPENISLDDIYSPQAFRERYKHFLTSTNELDYILRNRRLNGLDSYGAVIESRSGRRLSIVLPRFTNWWIGGKK